MTLLAKYLHKLYLIYFKWKNKHNKSVIFQKHCHISDTDFFEGNNNVGGRIYNSYIGYGTYIIGENGYINNCKIGRFCSIASNCHIGLGSHPLNTVSTSPLFYDIYAPLPINFLPQNVSVKKAPIDNINKRIFIGNDVWLGYNVCIKEGITIGDGAVIGAKSLVTKDIPPYSVAVGSPAKVIKYRFSEEQIKKLLDIKWWDKDIEWINKNIPFFSDIDTFITNNELS